MQITVQLPAHVDDLPVHQLGFLILALVVQHKGEIVDAGRDLRMNVGQQFEFHFQGFAIQPFRFGIVAQLIDYVAEIAECFGEVRMRITLNVFAYADCFTKQNRRLLVVALLQNVDCEVFETLRDVRTPVAEQCPPHFERLAQPVLAGLEFAHARQHVAEFVHAACDIDVRLAEQFLLQFERPAVFFLRERVFGT